MNEPLVACTLETYFKKQNDDLFSVDSDYKILSNISTKKNKNIYQTILQVDIDTYTRIINRGNIIVG